MFIGLLSACKTASLDESLASNSEKFIKDISLNNRPCQARPTLVNINSNEPLYSPFTVSAHCQCKCRLNESACYLRQKWNQDECWCECKEVDGVLVNTVTHGILVHVLVRVTRHVKLTNI